MASVPLDPPCTVNTDTRDADQQSQKLTKEIREGRGCGIAIANKTKFSFVNGKRFVVSGTLNAMASDIPPNRIGLIRAGKSVYSLLGSFGVLTYTVIDPSRSSVEYNLQIMWHVSYNQTLFDSWVNIDIGVEHASSELYKKLFKGDKGMLNKAKDTPYIAQFGSYPSLSARVFMGDGFKSALSITLRSNESK